MPGERLGDGRTADTEADRRMSREVPHHGFLWHDGQLWGGDRLVPGWHVWEVTRARWPQIIDGPWDELVAAVGGYVTQTLGWVEYALATDYRRAVLIAGVDESGAPRAAAVGFMSVPRWPLSGFSTIRFLGYPSTGGDVTRLESAMAACERVAKARGCVSVEFVAFGQSDATAVIRRAGYTLGEKLEYVLDLTCGEQALWTRLRPNHRRNVARSQKAGVRILRAESLGSMQALRAVQVEVAQRHAAKGDAFSLPSQHDYSALHRALVTRGLGRIYCGYVDDEVVSALFLTTYAGRARVLYVGSTEQGYETRGAFALYWQSIADLSRQGFVELSLGAASPSPEIPHPGSPAYGLHRFKIGFGPQIRRVASLYKQLRPAAVRIHRAVEQLRVCFARREQEPSRRARMLGSKQAWDASGDH